MDEIQKNAYRHLLYHAMLDIRAFSQSRGSESYNPLVWRRQYRDSRIAGAIADWLHNLACYTARDFVGFDEIWFWKEYDHFSRRCAAIGWDGYVNYRRRFDANLEESGNRAD